MLETDENLWISHETLKLKKSPTLEGRVEDIIKLVPANFLKSHYTISPGFGPYLTEQVSPMSKDDVMEIRYHDKVNPRLLLVDEVTWSKNTKLWLVDVTCLIMLPQLVQ